MGSSNASRATPEGVRAGDRAALEAVVERRGPAVVAFCTQVCAPDDATRAAAEAFARFRAAVRDAQDPDLIDPEQLLRGATRHAAASMARTTVDALPHGKLRARGTQTCEHVPTMLAARANAALGEADLERLARHLDRCERCEAVAAIFHRAELAYQDPPFETLDLDTTTVLLDALAAVPMEAIGRAPAPAPTEPDPDVTPEDGAIAADAHETEPDDLDLRLEPQALDAEATELADPVDEVEAADPDATVEWDSIVSPPEDYEAGAAAPLLAGGRERRAGGLARAVRILLPAVVVTAAIVGVLFAAGVVGGDDGTPPQTMPRSSAGIERPVLTPLPVTVADAEAGSKASTTPTTPEGTTLP